MITVLVALSLLSADPAWLTDFVSSARSQATRDIETAKNDLEAGKRGRVNPRFGDGLQGEFQRVGKGIVFRDPASKKRFLTKAEERLANAQGVLSGSIPDFPPQPEIGDAGVLKTYRVRQVVNPKEAIVDIVEYLGSLNGYGYFPIWLTGADTSKWTDGKFVDFALPVRVSGTKQYATAGGSVKTIPLATVLTKEEVDRFRELMLDKKP